MEIVLKPWYAVATPREDIREGRLAEAVFAANVWAVVQGTAPGFISTLRSSFGRRTSRLGWPPS